MPDKQVVDICFQQDHNRLLKKSAAVDGKNLVVIEEGSTLALSKD